MAQIKDVPKVLRSLGFVPLAKKVWAEVNEDDVFTWGSALAYAWIFAIFPFMIFLLTLAPYLPGGAKKQIMDQVSNVAYSSVGGDAGEKIVNSVNDVMSKQKGGLLSIGLILAIWGASGGMVMTMNALDKAYYVHCTRSFIKQRAIAIGLTVATAVLILAVVFLLPIGAAIITYLANHSHIGLIGKILINIVRYVVALAMLFGIVSLIYYFGPCIKQKYHLVTPGAIFTVIVWIVLAFVFGFYVGHFGNFNATYGALGAAIIMLLFFYINAVVLLIGAEINSVLDFETLNVKPGATDLTQAKAKAEYDDKHAGEEHATQQGAGQGKGHEHEPVHLPIIPAPAPAHRARNLLIFTSSFLALRFAWRQFWALRAKRRAKELAKARIRYWWWPWRTT
ncbi:MAG: ribonuclease [Phycisphaerales bacterium]|nr:ribonuclease [Phycisphaerales bacterium]